MKKELKIERLQREFLSARLAVNTIGKINTSLPKKKAVKFDRIEKHLIAKLSVARFNFNQEIRKVNEYGRDN